VASLHQWRIGGEMAGDGKELSLLDPAALAYLKGKDADSEEAQDMRTAAAWQLYA
jgi:hypothetical protein